MENNIIVFNYQGSNIPFELTGNDVMINATEMAKPFGKKISEWKRLPSTQEYLNAILDMGFSRIENLIISSKGGSHNGSRGGTWMYRLVALEFARWLSPEFSVWCNMKIDEIINQEYAFRDAEIQKLTEENNNLQGMIQSMKPQVDYYKDILTTSENLYSTEEVCKELGLGISSKTLLSKLENIRYIYRRPDGKWFLSSTFDSLGYIKLITIKDKKTDKPRNVRRWTEEGKYWIWSLRKKLVFS